MTQTYRTIDGDLQAEVEVKRSRFLAHLERVEDEAAARAVVEAARSRHWDARHHCSAFVLGADARVERSNDDGEPAGTAGAPMLEVLRGAGVSDVVAVVTRWFGGTLLGTGGLIRAYGDAVRAALADAPLLERRLLQRAQLTLDIGEVGRVENDVRSRGFVVADTRYDATSATLTLDLTSSQLEAAPALVGSLVGRAVDLDLLDPHWVDHRPDRPA